MVPMLHLKLAAAIALICNIALPASADRLFAKPSNAPVNIYADQMSYNIKTGISEYIGNVRVTQEKIELTGDKVVANTNESSLKTIKVTGAPAIYRQQAEDGSFINAKSEVMEYLADENMLVLTINARLEQAGHVVESQRIVYDTVKEVVIAGDKQPGKRVNITITPDNVKKTD